MATEKQYEVLRSAYEEEEARLSELVTRAKVYLSLETFFFGALVFKVDMLAGEIPPRVYIVLLFLLSIIFLFAALLCTVRSLKIMTYEAPFDLRKYIDSLGPKQPSDSDFLDDRIVDLAVATERNTKNNDQRADLLHAAGWFMVVGFAAAVVFVSAFLLESINL